MRLLKKITTVFCIMGVVSMNSMGCNNAVSYEELATQKLEEQYDMAFEIEKVQEHNIFDGYYTVIAYQKDDPKTLFRATINEDGSGESDNYVCKLVCQKIADEVAKNLDNLNGTYYIYCTPLIDSVGLTDVEMTVEQYMERFPAELFNIYLNYCPERMNAEELYQAISHTFDGLEFLSGDIYLYVVNENTLYDIQKYLEENDRMYDEYKTIADAYYLGNIPFEKGKLMMTEAEIKDMVRN